MLRAGPPLRLRHRQRRRTGSRTSPPARGCSGSRGPRTPGRTGASSRTWHLRPEAQRQVRLQHRDQLDRRAAEHAPHRGPGRRRPPYGAHHQIILLVYLATTVPINTTSEINAQLCFLPLFENTSEHVWYFTGA